VVAKVKPIIENLIGGPEEPGGEEPEHPATEPTTQKGIEDDTEAKVRAALEGVTKEKEHDAEHEALHQRVLERPPRQVSRLTKAIWGDEP
jgi:hypothetical protein